MKRDIQVSIINGILNQRDAISAICLHTCEALRRFARDRRFNLRYRMFTHGADIDSSHVRVRRSVEELLSDPFFHQSDLLIYNYGIHGVLFDSIFLVPRHKRVLGIFHGITHPWLVNDPALRDCLVRSHEMSRGLWHADRVLCNSQFSVEELRRAGLPAERLVRIPLAARTRGCSPGSRSGAPSRPARLLYVGRMVRAKGIGDLIEALRILRARGSDPVHLTLVGSLVISSPEDIAAFRRQIRQHGLDRLVRWEFDASGERLEQLYAESDAFVMPSYHEGFCMPLIEALSHGLPIVHSDRGAIPETSGGLGLTFAAGQPESLAGCLGRFLEASSRSMVPTDRGVLDRDEWLRQVSHHLENYTFQSFYEALVPHLADLMIPVPAQVKAFLSRAWLDAMARAGRPEIRQTSELPPRFISALVETGAVTHSVADRVLKGPHRLSRPAESSPLRRLKAILKRMPLVGAGAYRLKRVLVRHPALYNGLKSRADRCLRLVDRARAALRGGRLEQVRGGLTRRLRVWAHAIGRIPFVGILARDDRPGLSRPSQISEPATGPGRAVDALPGRRHEIGERKQTAREGRAA